MHRSTRFISHQPFSTARPWCRDQSTICSTPVGGEARPRSRRSTSTSSARGAPRRRDHLPFPETLASSSARTPFAGHPPTLRRSDRSRRWLSVGRHSRAVSASPDFSTVEQSWVGQPAHRPRIFQHAEDPDRLLPCPSVRTAVYGGRACRRGERIERAQARRNRSGSPCRRRARERLRG